MSNNSYQHYCQRLPKLPYGQGKESSDTRLLAQLPNNHPSDFETLSSPEQEALCYWIQHTMIGADQLEANSSYSLKHQFEQEGFYITNGQFKGAMLLVGFLPKNAYELNWLFRIKPARKINPPLEGRTYSLACFDKEFARLLLLAGHLSFS